MLDSSERSLRGAGQEHGAKACAVTPKYSRDFACDFVCDAARGWPGSGELMYSFAQDPDLVRAIPTKQPLKVWDTQNLKRKWSFWKISWKEC